MIHISFTLWNNFKRSEREEENNLNSFGPQSILSITLCYGTSLKDQSGKKNIF